METTLHQQLKEHFREANAPIEVRVGRYRIDVVNQDRLVEVQRSSLSSIRTKIENLLADGYKLDVVKPIIVRKRLIKLDAIDGKEVDRRWSPYSGSVFDFFDELLYFTRIFPHPNLRMLVPLISIEEIRYPGHGRRRRWRANDHLVKDQQILEISETSIFSDRSDLVALLPEALRSSEFDTKGLAEALSVPRYTAQKIAYVMRKIGALTAVGKNRNTIIYQAVAPPKAKRASKARSQNKKRKAG